VYGLRQTVAPATSPVTTTEAKLHARLDVDTIDADLQLIIDGATEQIEGLIDRQIVTATYRFTMPCWPPTLWLPLGRTQSVTSIKYYDPDNAQQTLSASLYRVDANQEPAVISSTTTFPISYTRSDAIEIIYTVGYGTAAQVPAGLKGAILMLVTHRFEHRGDDSTTEMTGTKTSAAVPQNIFDLAARYELGDEWTAYENIERTWSVTA